GGPWQSNDRKRYEQEVSKFHGASPAAPPWITRWRRRDSSCGVSRPKAQPEIRVSRSVQSGDVTAGASTLRSLPATRGDLPMRQIHATIRDVERRQPGAPPEWSPDRTSSRHTARPDPGSLIPQAPTAGGHDKRRPARTGEPPPT